jgi:hypothetical protein
MDDTLYGGTYEIIVGASLPADWSEWFDGFEVADEETTTRLRGRVADQAELHGLLYRLRDLGIPIFEIRRIATHTEAPWDNK